MAKQFFTGGDGKTYVGDTETGRFSEAKKDSGDIPIVSDVVGAVVDGSLNVADKVVGGVLDAILGTGKK